MPFYHDDWLTLYQGDALSVLRGLPAEHVDAVITDRIPLAQGAEVFTDNSYRRHGKILIVP